jgi:CDP-glucose 4,6-dehydratase
MGKSHLEPIILNQATNEIIHQYLCAKKAREILNWYPRYFLEEGLKETIEWYKIFLSKQDHQNSKEM